MLFLTAILVDNKNSQTFKTNCSENCLTFCSVFAADKRASVVFCCYCQSDVIIISDVKNDTIHDL